MTLYPERFDIEAAADAIARRNEKEARALRQRRAQAQETGRRIAQALRAADRGIAAVWGFGSTFEDGLPYRGDSDIDLAVEGGDIFRLVPLTEGTPFSVDLVGIGGQNDYFADRIRTRGTPL